MDGDLGDLLGGLAETFGLGELVKGALRGGSAPARDDDAENATYVYERLLTRPRDPGVNDR